MGAHALLGVVAADAERHDAERGKIGEAIKHPGEGVVKHPAVVQSWAHDHLTVHLDAVVEQRSQPTQACGSPTVPKHLHSDLWVRGVDRDVQGAEALSDDPLEVGLREASEGGEVPIQEAQAVVVVLEIEALPEARRELVDEAELAVVVASAHLVEQSGLHVDPEGLPRSLVDLQRELQATAPDIEHRVAIIHEKAPLDDVPRHLAVDRQDLVPNSNPSPVGRRTRRDGDNAGSGHHARVRRWDREPVVTLSGDACRQRAPCRPPRVLRRR